MKEKHEQMNEVVLEMFAENYVISEVIDFLDAHIETANQDVFKDNPKIQKIAEKSVALKEYLYATPYQSIFGFR